MNVPQPVLLTGVILFHAVGAAHVLHALFRVRSPSATIAWIISLLTFPWVSIPLYWFLGRDRLTGYVNARRSDDKKVNEQLNALETSIKPHRVEPQTAFLRCATKLAGQPVTRGNDADLLIDGDAIFERIFEDILTAKSYILIHFYIVKNDVVGQRFQKALLERLREGVKVYFLFDELGSKRLPSGYLHTLMQAGAECHPFGRTRHWWSRLQLNFRNHRKIIVIDGTTALIGGVNVGDEYLGHNKRFGNWRDTHLRLEGPAAQSIQLVFMEDWFWATHQIPPLNWASKKQAEDAAVAIVPTGPADDKPSFQLLIAEAANSAYERLWIASPYFVPDDGVLTALQTAALRGVDVRILLPEKPDHLLVWLSSFTYYYQTLPYGIRLFRYHAGFMHQKAFLVDNNAAGIGTGNLDNRSLRLNFEITALLLRSDHIDEVSSMFSEDFRHSHEVMADEFTKKPIYFKLAAKLSRLLAPVQ